MPFLLSCLMNMRYADSSLSFIMIIIIHICCLFLRMRIRIARSKGQDYNERSAATRSARRARSVAANCVGDNPRQRKKGTLFTSSRIALSMCGRYACLSSVAIMVRTSQTEVSKRGSNTWTSNFRARACLLKAVGRGPTYRKHLQLPV